MSSEIRSRDHFPTNRQKNSQANKQPNKQTNKQTQQNKTKNSAKHTYVYKCYVNVLKRKMCLHKISNTIFEGIINVYSILNTVYR